MMTGFMEFVRKQGIVGLAIGFILGAAVGKVVTSLVNDIINPIVGVLLGNAEGLKSAFLQVGPAKIMYGNFVSNILDFLILAAVVYFVIKGLGFDKLDKKD